MAAKSQLGDWRIRRRKERWSSEFGVGEWEVGGPGRFIVTSSRVQFRDLRAGETKSR